jgi:energy-converting hydrogenase Eha subunit H
MKIFKLYFKILKKNIAIVSVYFIVFICMSVIMAVANTESNVTGDFEQAEVKIAFVDYDNTEVTRKFKATNKFARSNTRSRR